MYLWPVRALLMGLLAVVGWAVGGSTAFGDVDHIGAFQTTVPIRIPAFHGLQPSLSLAYSSSGGNGWLGRGWSLQGVSVIRRSSPTGTGLPQWVAEDTYSIDGLGLVDCRLGESHPPGDPLLASPSCAHPVTGTKAYTARVEGYQRLAFDPAGRGSWTVWRADGVRAAYEPGLTSSKGTVEWWLSSMTDLSGNVVHLDWTTPTEHQVAVLAHIRYGVGDDVDIRFLTEPRPDVITAANGSGLETNATRLRAIDVTAAGQRLRAYDLTYQAGGMASGESILTSVQQFGSDATVDASGVHGGTSLPATVFGSATDTAAGAWSTDPPVKVGDWASGWPTGPDDRSRWSTVLDGAAGAGTVRFPSDSRTVKDGKGSTHSFDADGDGLVDTVLVQNYPSRNQTDVHVELSLDSGGYQGVTSTFTWAGCSPDRPFCAAHPAPEVQVADVDGDGTDDLVFVEDLAGGTQHSYVEQVALSRDRGRLVAQGGWVSVSAAGGVHVGDVTGDGKADLVTIHTEPGCPLATRTGVGDGAGAFDFTAATVACWPGAQTVGSERWQLADVNGDLRSDLVGFAPASKSPALATAQAYVAVSLSGGGFDTHIVDTGRPWTVTYRSVCDQPGEGPVQYCTDTRTRVPALWTDADGDGRTDLVILRPDGDGVAAWTGLSHGDGTLDALTLGTTTLTVAALQDFNHYAQPRKGEEPPTVMEPAADLLSADVDGDGAGDLVEASVRQQIPAHSGVSIRRSISDRQGNWVAGVADTQRDWGCDGCWGPNTSTMAADVNGDGRADVQFAHASVEPGSDETWMALDVDPSPVRPTAAQLLRGDYNADGRVDLIYPVRTAAGVEVRVLLRQAGGGYRALPPYRQDLPAYVPAHLPQSAWMVADLNGDRRDDLVVLPPGRRVGVSLLALGAQLWYPQMRIMDSLDQQIGGGPAMFPSGRWVSADVDGDLITDLVHVGAGPAGAPGVLTVFGRPRGELQYEWLSEVDGVSDAVLADTTNWRPADVDADGHADLVYVNTRASSVQTLLRRGNGWRWVTSPLSTQVPVPCRTRGCPPPRSDLVVRTDVDDQAWTALDVNGDGAGDLVRVDADLFGHLLFQSLTSRGDGQFTPHANRTDVVAGGPQGGADVQHWYPADVNHDSHGDLVRVFNRVGELVVQTATSDGDGSWTLSTPSVSPGTLADLPATDRWATADERGDGTLEVSRIDLDRTSAEITVTGLRSRTPPESITSIDNGLGTTTEVGYRPITDTFSDDQPPLLQCRLPSGTSAQATVAEITTRDKATDAVDRSSLRYGCVHFSTLLHSVVGWADTWTTHAAAVNRPAFVEHVERANDDSGVVQPFLEEITDAEGHVLTSTRSHYEPLRDRATLPQIDLLSSVETSVCDLQGCATSRADLAHDDFGNLTSRVDVAAGSGSRRQTTTAYLHNDDVWLEGLTQLVRMVDLDHPADVLRASLTCYDGDPSEDCSGPSPTRGLPTRTRGWDSTRGAFRDLTGATYDAWGNQTSSTDAAGSTAETTYDPDLHLFPVTNCNALHQCATTATPWDRRAEAPTRGTDANGAVTHTTYDALGRVELTVEPSGARVELDYQVADGVGTRTTTTTVSGAGPPLWTRVLTDGLGRTYRTEKPAGKDGTRTSVAETRFSDASNRAEGTSLPRLADTSATWETLTYDAAGRLIDIKHPDGAATRQRYFVRDGFSGVETTDELGHRQTRLSDGWGRVISTEQPSTEHPGQLAITRHTYDVLGDRLTTTDTAGHTITDSYDSLGHKTSEDDPDRGISTYRYDVNGNRIEQTDARHRTTSFAYDVLDRRTSKTDHTTHAVATWRYDEPGHGYSVGRLTSEHDATARGCTHTTSHSYRYDRRGNITSDRRCIHGRRVAFTTRYDQLDRISTLRYPDRQKVGYRYDGSGNLRSVSGYVNGLSYDAAGSLVRATYRNGVTERWHYDGERTWLNSQTVARGGRGILDLSYRHLADGLIHSARSRRNAVQETYGYDALSRLTKVSGSYEQQITYDDLGNITSNSAIGSYSYPTERTCTTDQQTCAGPHAVTDAGKQTFGYDSAGDMVTATDPSTRRTLTWNTDGSLSRIVDTRAGTVANQYDGDGNRVQETTRGKDLKLFGSLADWTKQTGLRTYIYAGSRLIARHTSKATLWYHTDRLGSPRLITDRKGKPVSRKNYTPFGEAVRTKNDDPIGYAGQRSLGDTGLVDLNARSYDPHLARMLSADTIIPSSDPQALNRYSYAYNNPITYNDPSGHAPVDPEQDRNRRFLYWNLQLNLNGLGAGLPDNRSVLHEALMDSPSTPTPPALQPPPLDPATPTAAAAVSSTNGSLNQQAGGGGSWWGRAATQAQAYGSQTIHVLNSINPFPRPGLDDLDRAVIQAIDTPFRVLDEYGIVPREFWATVPFLNGEAALAELSTTAADGSEGAGFVNIAGQGTVLAGSEEAELFQRSRRFGVELGEYVRDGQLSSRAGDATSIKFPPAGPGISSLTHTHPSSGVALFSAGDLEAFSQAGYNMETTHSVLGLKWPSADAELLSQGLAPTDVVVKTSVTTRLMQIPRRIEMAPPR